MAHGSYRRVPLGSFGVYSTYASSLPPVDRVVPLPPSLSCNDNAGYQVNTAELDREKVYNYWESGPAGDRVQNQRDAQLKILTTMDVESLMVVLDDFEAKCSESRLHATRGDQKFGVTRVTETTCKQILYSIMQNTTTAITTTTSTEQKGTTDFRGRGVHS